MTRRALNLLEQGMAMTPHRDPILEDLDQARLEVRKVLDQMEATWPLNTWEGTTHPSETPPVRPWTVDDRD
jgi:hypothetical protein